MDTPSVLLGVEDHHPVAWCGHVSCPHQEHVLFWVNTLKVLSHMLVLTVGNRYTMFPRCTSMSHITQHSQWYWVTETDGASHLLLRVHSPLLAVGDVSSHCAQGLYTVTAHYYGVLRLAPGYTRCCRHTGSVQQLIGIIIQVHLG